jgi:starch synthase
MQVLANPERAREMGRAGRRRVEAQFSWTSIAERTEQVYAEAVDEFRRTSGD